MNEQKMGSSCNNTPCISGEVTGPGCWKCVGDTNGALTLSRLYALQENGQLDADSVNGIVSSIVAYGYIYASSQCEQAYSADQVIEIDCTNTAAGYAVAHENPNCDECKKLAQDVYNARMQLEADAHAENASYTPQVLTDSIKQAWFGLTGDFASGVCKYVCEQCVAENVSQNIQMKVVAECDVDTDAFISAFVSGMSQQAASAVTKHQQGLQSTGLEVNNDADIQNVSVNIANTISEMTSIKQLNSLKQSALSIQQMRVNPGSTSVAIQNSKQTISLSMFASLASQVYTDTSMKAAIDYNVNVKTVEIETSFYDLIQTLETTASTMESILEATLGQLVITFVAVIVMILIIFASLFFFRPQFLFGATLDDVGDKTLFEKGYVAK